MPEKYADYAFVTVDAFPTDEHPCPIIEPEDELEKLFEEFR